MNILLIIHADDADFPASKMRPTIWSLKKGCKIPIAYGSCPLFGIWPILPQQHPIMIVVLT